MNKRGIAEKLIESHRGFAGYAASLNERDFTFSARGKWSAGQHLEHILRSVSPVKTAFALPKFVPPVLFGKARRDSLDYETLVGEYQRKLAAGGKATGRFIPPEVAFENRVFLKNKLSKTIEDLNRRLESFSETQLDRYVLPHPILGKLTLREMLYFTIYHAGHHQRAARRNLE